MAVQRRLAKAAEMHPRRHAAFIAGGQIGTGTSFYGAPAAGEAFYRTDLDAPFVYAANRGKWLGALESDGGGFNGDLAQNTYMRASTAPTSRRPTVS